MDKINELLGKLDRQVTPAIKRKIDALNTLNQKYHEAYIALQADPENEELREALAEIDEFIEEQSEALEELLVIEVQKREAEKDRKPEAKPNSNQEPEKKEKSGVFGIVLGVVLLGASLGAINLFRNK